MNIVDVRNQLAQHPTKSYSKRLSDSIKYIAVHHSATKGGNAASFARYHVNTNNWPGIGYHYVILEDGTIQWANDLTTVSYHVGGYNTQAVGICLVGDFTDSQLATVQKQALKELCQYLFEKLNLAVADVKGHNEFNSAQTKCPGIDMGQFRAYLADDQVQIIVNGAKINVTAQLTNGITYVPLRDFAVALGYAVSWDGSTNTVYLTKEEQPAEIVQERNYYREVVKNIKNIFSKVE